MDNIIVNSILLKVSFYFFCVTLQSVAQNFESNFKQAIQLLDEYNLEELNSNTQYETELEKFYIEIQEEIILKGKFKISKLDSIKHLESNNNLSEILKGDLYFYQKYSKDSLAFKHYNIALEKSLKLKNDFIVNHILKKILWQLYKNKEAYKLSLSYLKNYNKRLNNSNEKASYLYFKINTISARDKLENIDSLKIGLNIAKKTNNFFLIAKYYQMIGIHYSFFKKDDNNAMFFIKKACEFINKKKYQSFKNEGFGIYANYGLYLEKYGKLLDAKKYYLKADNINLPKSRLYYKVKNYENIANNALLQNQKDSAYHYLKKSLEYGKKFNEYSIARSINGFKTKFETEKKEKENLQLKQENLTSEAKRKQNQNLFYGALAILFFVGIIYYQNIKNSKRKRFLAEQQKELEKQKNITLLKEQEITTINAMVNGQEKERIRIAEDLHDNIGSVLATLKLHFENLKLNREKKHFDQEALYLKTEKLIDETYFKVRTLAHAKNAGVIANKGLLTAVKIMAEKISDANKINIEVLDFGLEKRLENSLELTIFRIIQELTTNIIKHAEATNATINLSLFDNNLNIILEDNGKGFAVKPSELKNDGMGLGSIKTRVKHLNGTFNIDSTLGKGTSIIIDIPL